jgi:hypothetical protein
LLQSELKKVVNISYFFVIVKNKFAEQEFFLYSKKANQQGKEVNRGNKNGFAGETKCDNLRIYFIVDS